MSHRRTTLSAEPRALLGRRAQLFAAASVAYNAAEAVVAIGAGAAALSIALVGFGLDSVVEMSSGLVILWQFRHPLPESRERKALRLIALSFFALAAYVTFESARFLVRDGRAESSTVGIVLAAVSLCVMPLLSWMQRRTGRTLSSGSVVDDSKQTLLCTYLSGILLVGLVANSALGWSWVDPLLIAAVAAKEGVAAWRGDSCCDMPTVRPPSEGFEVAAAPRASAADGCGCGDRGGDECCDITATTVTAPAHREPEPR